MILDYQLRGNSLENIGSCQDVLGGYMKLYLEGGGYPNPNVVGI